MHKGENGESSAFEIKFQVGSMLIA